MTRINPINPINYNPINLIRFFMNIDLTLNKKGIHVYIVKYE